MAKLYGNQFLSSDACYPGKSVRNVSSKMSIRPIIETWLELQTRIQEFLNPKSIHRNNVLNVLKHTRKLASHILDNAEDIQNWLNTYLATHREEICIRYWLESATEAFSKSLENRIFTEHIHSRIEEWDALFDDSMFGPYAVRYADAKEIVIQTLRRKNPELCDDEEILAKHKDKPCVSNGWSCDRCEDVEYAWARKLIQQAQATNHVLLNRSHHEECLRRILQSPIAKRIPTTWSLPTIYNGPYAWSEIPIETRDAMVQEAQICRGMYAKQGQTPFQACNGFVSILFRYSTGWSLQESELRTDWSMFRYLYTKLETVLHVIPLDLVRCQEIEEMFA